MKMKVLFLVTALEQGGLETYLLRFLDYYKNPNVIVLCKSGRLGCLYDQYIQKADRVIPFSLSYFNVIQYIHFYFFLKRESIDTICDFTGNFAGIPLYVAAKAGIKKRIAFYRGASNHFKEDPFRLLYNHFVRNLTFSYATKILSNSKAALDFFFPNLYEKSDKFKVIYNGIDITVPSIMSRDSLCREFNILPSNFIIGHTGRCNYAKNHDTIIQVAISLCLKYSDITFVLVGKGVKEKYSSLITEKKMEQRILLLGYRTDVLKILGMFDLFYFPSVTEGQPNALIEAMVHGLPFITSNIAPICETVPSDMRRLLLSPRDVESAVRTIERLYMNREELLLYKCTEWARNNYDANIQFEKFKREL